MVDNGMQDQIAKVARAYGAQLLKQRIRDPAAACNLGLRQGPGDIVLFTDAD